MPHNPIKSQNKAQKRPKNYQAWLFLGHFWGFLSLFGYSIQTASASNALQNQASPYLAMHANDPVHWQPFTQQTLKAANTQNRLILISSGYFSCHWCHVMQQESYQDAELANWMNANFINIKIDRELNTDLDDYLIDFTKQLTGSAGWPLHVVLTPQGWPFHAFSYLPKAALQTRLNKLQTLWSQQPQQITQLATQPKQTLPIQTTQPLDELKQLLYQQVNAHKDELSGGLQTTHKFPNTPLLLTLIQQTDLPEELTDWLKLTLDKMSQEHLMDRVNGGFFRYTIDPEWQTPHYEKMLYTQAQMIELYSLATTRFKEPRYAAIAQLTWQYVQHHLRNPATQLYMSSQSALDAKGQEGGHYQFSADTLKTRLNPLEFQIVSQAWQLTQPAPQPLGWLAKPTQTLWPSIRAKLQTSPQNIPVDHKSLLGWNGLLLRGLSSLYSVQPSTELFQHTEQLAQTLQKWLEQTTLPKALSDKNTPIDSAQLEDFVYLMQGLNAWQTINPQMSLNKTLMDRILNLFHHSQGWQTTTHPLLPGMQPQRLISDQATPSPGAYLFHHNKTLANEKNSVQQALTQQTNLIPFASYFQSSLLHDKVQ